MKRLEYSRRGFIQTLAVGGAACAFGFRPRFSWAVEGARAGSLKLGFFTDVHTRLEWDTPVALAQAAGAINARKPELIIGGGDYITDGFQSSAETVEPRWDAYFKMHDALEAPVHPVIGNHDLVAARPEDGTEASPDPRAIFRARFGIENTYRSWDAEGYHFILLDSIQVSDDDLKYHGMIGPEELDWLKADLARVSPGMPIVMATHLPLLTGFYQATEGSTFAAPANRVLVNNREVLKLFEHHNLILVLQGHLHVNEMLRWRNTMFITGGAICAKWWRGPWQGTEEGFGLVTLRGNQVDWEYVDYGWTARRP